MDDLSCDYTTHKTHNSCVDSESNLYYPPIKSAVSSTRSITSTPRRSGSQGTIGFPFADDSRIKMAVWSSTLRALGQNIVKYQGLAPLKLQSNGKYSIISYSNIVIGEPSSPGVPRRRKTTLRNRHTRVFSHRLHQGRQ